LKPRRISAQNAGRRLPFHIVVDVDVDVVVDGIVVVAELCRYRSISAAVAVSKFAEGTDRTVMLS
jgi:hypothetical protein